MATALAWLPPLAQSSVRLLQCSICPPLIVPTRPTRRFRRRRRAMASGSGHVLRCCRRGTKFLLRCRNGMPLELRCVSLGAWPRAKI
eukprot:1507114-Prymnesium_polylepis.1